MTLNEIGKVIDEANVVYNETKTGFAYYLCLKEFKDKAYHKLYFKDYIEAGNVLYYYNRSKVTGEMTLLAIVDHIDPEKKIVRKKLDEMTKEEVEQLKVKLCTKRGSCSDCPFHNKFYCYGNFPFWKKRYEECKDKEFDVEVVE